jgi:hypothetical protein
MPKSRDLGLAAGFDVIFHRLDEMQNSKKRKRTQNLDFLGTLIF